MTRSNGHRPWGRCPLYFLLILLVTLPRPGQCEGQVRHTARTASGLITDAATGDPVGAANIRILGTARGTISNLDGRYTLSLLPGPATIVFSHVAFQPDTVLADPAGDTTLSLELEPAPLVYPEVLVLAEDPALEIIRKAIASKRGWMDLLKSYRFEAYTRQMVLKDTSVASITESFSVGYVLSGDTLRERVIQKRQTANVRPDRNFAAVRRLVNFNDDRIGLFNMNINNERRSYTFTGPTAPDALEWYDYRLVRTRRVGGIEMYEIEMKPKTVLKPLFSGTITISDRSFAVVDVDLVPNETFGIPFIKDADLRYRQQFALYDSIFWLPADIRIEGGFDVSIVGIGLPRVGFSQISSIYNYEINVPVPDSIVARRRVTVDSSTTVQDTAYWRSDLVVPFTEEENRAYATLDSTQTLEEQFRPRGVLAELGSGGSGSLAENIDLRFNRVEGFYAGAGMEFRDVLPQTDAAARLGYGFSSRRWRYSVSLSARILPRRRLTAGAEAYRRTMHLPDGGYYEPLVNSLTSLFGKNDYRDYFASEGWDAWVESSAGRDFGARLAFTDRRETEMPVVTGYSFTSRGTPFRPNVTAAEGRLRSFSLSLRLGLESAPLDIITNDNIRVAVEHTSPSLLASGFDYTIVTTDVTYTFQTFASDLLFPPSFRLRIHAGKGFRAVPPQRMLQADTRLGILGPFGVLRAGDIAEFRGDAVAAASFEHNFRGVPFYALGLPFLYRNGIELVLHGGIARTWEGGRPDPGGWYSEAGAGINRILDVLRVDATWRFRDPRRFRLTLGVAYLL